MIDINIRINVVDCLPPNVNITIDGNDTTTRWETEMAIKRLKDLVSRFEGLIEHVGKSDRLKEEENG